MIKSSVGDKSKGAKNKSNDVGVIQKLINRRIDLLVPLKLFLALREKFGLGGQGSDDGAYDKLQKSGEFDRNGAEEGNSEGVFSKSEYEQGNKD